MVTDYSVTMPYIRIPQVFGFINDSTKDSRKIKRAIHIAIVEGIKKCLNAAIGLVEEIVPESIKREPPYPPSYDSETLMLTYIDFLTSEIRRHQRGKRTLRDAYWIEQEWEASYAEAVDEMVGVNWSKAGSHGGFIKEIDDFIRANICKYIDTELNRVDPTLTLLYTVT